MARILGRLGADPVLQAADGQKVLDAWDRTAADGSASRPSVVLLDRNMPGLVGEEVAARLRDRGFAGIALLVTGDQDVSAADAPPPGVQAVLCKPVTKAALVQALHSVGVRPMGDGTGERA